MDAKTQEKLKMYIINDWEVKEEYPDHVVLRRNEATIGGHILVFILTFWFTLGLGNLIYWLVSRKTKKVMI